MALADYTTAHGVPTASALANQAKSIPRKQDKMIQNEVDDDSMSVDETDSMSKYGNATKNVRRGKKSKGRSSSKNKDGSAIEAIQYGPILVKPRRRTAPTLSSGRKSKDEPVGFQLIVRIKQQIQFLVSSFHQKKM